MELFHLLPGSTGFQDIRACRESVNRALTGAADVLKLWAAKAKAAPGQLLEPMAHSPVATLQLMLLLSCKSLS
jgi:hypothetical protein